MSRSVYDQMLNDVQIRKTPRLSNPALQVDPNDAPSQAVEYERDNYTRSDVIKVGVGGRFQIPAGATAQIPAPTLQNPFQPIKATNSSAVAEFLLISRMNIAAVDLLDGDPICADVFSEVSLQSEISWPTVQTGQAIRVAYDNTDVNPHEPRLTLTGWRLRA